MEAKLSQLRFEIVTEVLIKLDDEIQHNKKDLCTLLISTWDCLSTVHIINHNKQRKQLRNVLSNLDPNLSLREILFGMNNHNNRLGLKEYESPFVMLLILLSSMPEYKDNYSLTLDVYPAMKNVPDHLSNEVKTWYDYHRIDVSGEFIPYKPRVELDKLINKLIILRLKHNKLISSQEYSKKIVSYNNKSFTYYQVKEMKPPA
jgi:hypothetical protein